MPTVRSGYELQFEDILSGSPVLGRASVVPWDKEIFGFPVASYQIGTEELDSALKKEFRERLLLWLQCNQVLLAMCAIPAANSFWKIYLPEAGFCFVDFGLKATLNGLQTTRLPEARTELRTAERRDWEAIEAIAEQAFHHGRYHADALFPRHLANLRYRQWVRNALAAAHASAPVYVMGEPGLVQGFYHVTIEGHTSDLRLAALAPELHGTMLGFDLYVSLLHILKDLGARRVMTSISAANTAVMNVYSMLGFSFSDAEAIYHWHAEGLRKWGSR